MNNNQLDLFSFAMMCPFGQTIPSHNLNFSRFSNPVDNKIRILQEILKIEALRNAKNATIDQVTRMEEYFAKNLNSTMWPK
jgi:hypothetical protein